MPSLRPASADDPRLADFHAVGDPELVRRRGLFVGEGRRVVADLMERMPGEIEALLLTRAALDALGDALERLGGDVPVYVVDGPSAMQDVTGFRFHQGCLALARRPTRRGFTFLETLIASEDDPLLVALEGVTDPDNVGAIFRTAAAFGASAILIAAGTASPLYRKALRTSMGTVLGLPWAECEDWPADLLRLSARGLRLLALTPGGGDACRPWDEVVREKADRGAVLLLGSEEQGLSRAALEATDVRLRIPMTDAVDSLNVAAAAAVALDALTRSRPSRA